MRNHTRFLPLLTFSLLVACSDDDSPAPQATAGSAGQATAGSAGQTTGGAAGSVGGGAGSGGASGLGGAAGQGSASPEVMAMGQRLCLVTTALKCPKDPTQAACEQEFVSDPTSQTCLPQYDALADCLEAQPAKDFACGNDQETGLTTGACNDAFAQALGCVL